MDRNLVGRFWSRLKENRRIATQYSKAARYFLGMIRVMSIMLLLRQRKPLSLPTVIHTA